MTPKCMDLNATHVMLISLLAATTVMGQAGGWNDPQDLRSPNGQNAGYWNDVIPGVVVIKFKRSNSIAGTPILHSAEPLLATLSKLGVTSLAHAFPHVAPVSDADVAAGKVDLSRIYHASIPSSMNPAEVAARIAQLPGVEYAEPRYYYYLCDIPNDSAYVSMQQVYFERMKVPDAWTLQRGSPNVIIATVDGGTNWQHPDLLANIWINPGEDLNHDGRFQESDLNGVDDDHNSFADDIIGWNFADSTYNPRGSLPLSADHGTKTASLFGAVTDNNLGMAGTSWNCRVLPVCAADPVSDDRILWGPQGIQYAADMGAHVINCSWKQRGFTQNPDKELQEAINYATLAGALVVAAAGNVPPVGDDHRNNDEVPYYPASYDHVLSVGATEDTSDALAYFSHYGLNVSAFAPGMRIRVALDDGSYNTEQGTSLSAPIVAGLAGLLKSAHPTWGPEQIAAQIRMTSDPIDASNPSFAGSLGHGRVNFYRALSEVPAGVVFIGGTFHKPSDTATLFMTDDTVIFSSKIRNVLPHAAENLSFSVTADPALIPLPQITGPTRLDPNAEDSVHIPLLVSSPGGRVDVSVRVRWNANTDEWDARLFRTTVYARGGIWTRQTSPTTVRLISIHAVSGSVAWAAGSNSWQGATVILRTTDGGKNWASVSVPAGFYPVCIFAIDSLHAWAGGGGEGELIYMTANGGVTWARQDFPLPRYGYVMRGLWFADAAHGFALGDRSTAGRIVLLRTSDGGTTWAHIPGEPAADTVFEAANLICGTDKEHIWYTATDSLVYRSTDGGETWSSAKAGALRMLALAMHDDSVGIACSGAGADSDEPGTFARTTDGGISWQMLPPPMPDQAWGAAFPPGSKAWLTGGRTVACSPDHGETWAPEQAEPFSGALIALSFSDSANGWMTTNQGEILHYRPLLTTVRLESSRNLPVQALLHQNYPNPFNPGTTIRYELPKSSEVRLSVYDILGREVTVLVNERKNAGVHQVRFDGTRFASGVYFYTLTAGSYTQTRKLLLLR